MTLLADRTEGRWDGRWSDDGRAQSRTRARAHLVPSAIWQFFYHEIPTVMQTGKMRSGWDGDDQRPPPKTYRTVCVRLCDGYYFPISFSVTADRLGREQAVCESRCGTQGRLFVQHSVPVRRGQQYPVAGRPYRQLHGVPLSQRVRVKLHMPTSALGAGIP